MLKFRDLLARHTWAEIEPVFLKRFPDAAKLAAKYGELVQELLHVRGRPTQIVLRMEMIDDDPETAPYPWTVADHPDGRHQVFLEGHDWAEWVEMGVDLASVERFGVLEFLAVSLWRASFAGFERNDSSEMVAEWEETKASGEFSRYEGLQMPVAEEARDEPSKDRNEDPTDVSDLASAPRAPEEPAN